MKSINGLFNKRRVITAVCLCIGVAMIALGIAHDDLKALWQTATKICLECIGIG